MHAVRILDICVFYIALVIFNTHVFGGKYFLFGKRGDFNRKICTGSDVEFSVKVQGEMQCSFQCFMHQACITVFYSGENKTCTACSKFYNTTEDLGDSTGTIGYYVVSDLTEGYLEVSASSYDWGGRPEYALNGIKDGLHKDETCHHSGSESDPWWEVTLRKPYYIRRLVITNRVDSNFGGRFRNITIYVGDEVCATYPGPAGWEQLTIEIRCTRENLYGQTVRIVKDGTILTLCEVEIYVN